MLRFLIINKSEFDIKLFNLRIWEYVKHTLVISYSETNVSLQQVYEFLDSRIILFDISNIINWFKI